MFATLLRPRVRDLEDRVSALGARIETCIQLLGTLQTDVSALARERTILAVEHSDRMQALNAVYARFERRAARTAESFGVDADAHHKQTGDLDSIRAIRGRR